MHWPKHEELVVGVGGVVGGPGRPYRGGQRRQREMQLQVSLDHKFMYRVFQVFF